MNFLRSLVSGDRHRLVEEAPDGHSFNLDLSYITPRVVAMAIPASGVEALYRNPISSVARYLQSKHKDKYMVFNLSERHYDTAPFGNRVVELGFPDHHAPPVEVCWTLCKTIDSWLQADPENVAVVHCLAGKGRTGVVVTCCLLFTGFFFEEREKAAARAAASRAAAATRVTGGDARALAPPAAAVTLLPALGGARNSLPRTAAPAPTPPPPEPLTPLGPTTDLPPPAVMARQVLELFRSRRGEGVKYPSQERTVRYFARVVHDAILANHFELVGKMGVEGGGGERGTAAGGGAGAAAPAEPSPAFQTAMQQLLETGEMQNSVDVFVAAVRNVRRLGSMPLPARVKIRLSKVILHGMPYRKEGFAPVLQIMSAPHQGAPTKMIYNSAWHSPLPRVYQPKQTQAQAAAPLSSSSLHAAPTALVLPPSHAVPLPDLSAASKATAASAAALGVAASSGSSQRRRSLDGGGGAAATSSSASAPATSASALTRVLGPHTPSASPVTSPALGPSRARAVSEADPAFEVGVGIDEVHIFSDLEGVTLCGDILFSCRQSAHLTGGTEEEAFRFSCHTTFLVHEGVPGVYRLTLDDVDLEKRKLRVAAFPPGWFVDVIYTVVRDGGDESGGGGLGAATAASAAASSGSNGSAVRIEALPGMSPSLRPVPVPPAAPSPQPLASSASLDGDGGAVGFSLTNPLGPLPNAAGVRRSLTRGQAPEGGAAESSAGSEGGAGSIPGRPGRRGSAGAPADFHYHASVAQTPVSFPTGPAVSGGSGAGGGEAAAPPPPKLRPLSVAPSALGGEGADPGILCGGWLWKRGAGALSRGWKRRWFLLYTPREGDDGSLPLVDEDGEGEDDGDESGGDVELFRELSAGSGLSASTGGDASTGGRRASITASAGTPGTLAFSTGGRYAVPVSGVLAYFKSPEDTIPKGRIHLSRRAASRVYHVSAAAGTDPRGRVGDRPNVFRVRVRGRSYYLQATSAADMQRWMSALRSLDA